MGKGFIVTKISINYDQISRLCGNRGGVHGSIAYAAAEAISKKTGGRLAVFGADSGDDLCVCEYAYVPGTYQSEITAHRYRLHVSDGDCDCFSAEGGIRRRLHGRHAGGSGGIHGPDHSHVWPLNLII